ncbi:MAG: hydantoinase/oxoprolinase family protein [Lentisphaeraceae bacterium]|nr:hydantoinase/oxoprolinase family protein [Lentisphaeraceae bacterium]
MSTANKWEFKVDVGGTFTDYIAISPERQTISGKLLSSGCLKGSLNDDLQSNEFFDDNFSTVAPDLFKDFKIRFYHENEVLESRVIDFNNDSGKFTLTDILHIPQNTVYELFTGEVSPVIAIRLVTGTGLAMKFPQVNLRLGTTIGTNALLERKGAKVGLLCTKGFKDVWTIGNQSRSALFDLKVQQPKTLLSAVKEIDERVDTNGNVLAPVNRAEVEKACRELQEQGIEALAICLVNSYVNQHHENEICEIARQCGFEHISVSSKLSRRIKLLDRGDTTLVDAYLTPIIAAYVKSINKSLPDATLRLMTSAGGLVSTQNLTAKDLLFSGPAGGVNGFVSAALAEGFNHAIGFDMGGTSTDVKRYGGEYEYQYETTKAGVRVVAPMFAIETVAAGGGSICHYDGQRLLVGPESAGASPGPACYGSGGPLTVTDLNLFNGKIDADAFPFKLDIEAVEAQLSKISEQIFASEGRRMSLLEIADGFSRIADFIMAEAIRNISSAKGYKPADHLLVAFGGAGPQHA